MACSPAKRGAAPPSSTRVVLRRCSTSRPSRAAWTSAGCRWLRRRGLIDERAAEERSNEAPALSPMEACEQASLFAGEFARVQESEPREENEDAEARLSTKKKSPWSAEVGGVDVHAGVTIRAR
jgi:hypothetical protein